MAWRVGRYIQTPPPADLSDVIEALWTHIEPPSTSPDAATTHRVVADAALSLVFVGDASARPSEGRICLLGPVRTPRIFTPLPGEMMVAARLKLECCRSLLGVAPEEHADTLVDLESVNPRLGWELLHGLGGCDTPGDVTSHMVSFCRQRRFGVAVQNECTVAGRALDRLREREGRLRMSELAGELRVSDRHLRRVVRCHAGISPVLFRSILRFHALLQHADEIESPDWARLAAQHGYADQSHLIRDAQTFACASPKTIHRERRAEPDAPFENDSLTS